MKDYEAHLWSGHGMGLQKSRTWLVMDLMGLDKKANFVKWYVYLFEGNLKTKL